MAERPVFLSTLHSGRLVETTMVSFDWHKGMSAAQKKKNVQSLHLAASKLGLEPLLETSSKSDYEAGRRLSAFNLRLNFAGLDTTVESAFQGSKVFEDGGPYTELYGFDSRSAKLDHRLQTSGKLIAFDILGQRYPLSPPTVFYDWLYINALMPHRDWLQRLRQFRGFTDIEFNPNRSINCQARACALYISLDTRGLLDEALVDFDSFQKVQSVAYW